MGRAVGWIMRPSPLAVLLGIGVLLGSGCLGAVQSSATSGAVPGAKDWKAPDVPTIPAKAMLANLSRFVKANPYRADDTSQHKAARDDLAREFESSGLRVWRHDFVDGIHQQNVCGIKVGDVRPDEWVIVGGHYDTFTDDRIVLDRAGQGTTAPGKAVSEGAYDDGSGTWLTMELAKSFAGRHSYYSILFCAFDGEERGLQGSRALRRDLDGGSAGFPLEWSGTHAVLDFDMFGICYPVRAPITAMANLPVLAARMDAVRRDLKVPDDMWNPTTSGGGSDLATWQKDTPTMFFISDMGKLGVPTPNPQSMTPSTPGYYPWWHWQDTMETMSAMAGGPSMLEASFQTALTLATQSLASLAWHPELDLSMQKAAAS
jgi:hypothetical protein